MVKMLKLAIFPELAATFAVTKQTYVARDTTRGSSPGHEVKATLYLSNSSMPGPVVAFAHGFGLNPDLYPIAEELAARRGCVIFSPHNSGVPNTESLALDQTFLISHAVQQSATNASSPLYGRVGSRTLLMGHSLGGGSTILAADPGIAAQYPSPSAIATLSLGTYTIPNALKSAPLLPPRLPALLMTATEDCIDPPEKNSMPVFDALTTECAMVVSVVGGSHCQYADENSGCSMTEKLCGAKPNISRAQQREAALEVLLPYIDAALVNDNPLSWQAFTDAVERAEIAGRVRVLAHRGNGCGVAAADLDAGFAAACQRFVAGTSNDTSLTVEVVKASSWKFTTTKPSHFVDSKNITRVTVVTHIESTELFTHSVAIKMESRAGLAHGEDVATCVDLHHQSLKKALSALTEEQRTKYGNVTKELMFLPDRQYHTGLYVINSKLNITETDHKVLVQAPSFLAKAGLPGNFGGKQYCRLLPPAAIHDWILRQLEEPGQLLV